MPCPTIAARRQFPFSRVLSDPFSLFIVLSLLVLPQTVNAQSGSMQANLELNKPIEREITGGDVHSYSLSLQTDHYVHFEVDQRSIDLAVTL
jgi:hypothetical protein